MMDRDAMIFRDEEEKRSAYSRRSFQVIALAVLTWCILLALVALLLPKNEESLVEGKPPNMTTLESVIDTDLFDQLKAQSPFVENSISVEEESDFSDLQSGVVMIEDKRMLALKKWEMIKGASDRLRSNDSFLLSDLPDLSYEPAASAKTLKDLKLSARFEIEGLPKLIENPDLASLTGELQYYPGDRFTMAIVAETGRVELCLPLEDLATERAGVLAARLRKMSFVVNDERAKEILLWGKVRIWKEREEVALGEKKEEE